MKKLLFVVLIVNLTSEFLFASAVNNIDEDPWLRTWLFVGPFDNYETAEKISDSLSSFTFDDIQLFASRKGELEAHIIKSKSPHGTHSIYQYYPEHNEKYIVGFCEILSKTSQSVYYNQLIHEWDEVSFFLDGRPIVSRSRDSFNWESTKIKAGKSIARIIVDIKPSGLNYFNGYLNKFQIGLFKNEFISKINGTVSHKGRPVGNAKIKINNLETFSRQVIADENGFYECLLINQDQYKSITITSEKDELKFYNTLKILKAGDSNKVDIKLDKYESEISGKVLTLYEAKYQPDVLVKLVDLKTNEIIEQGFTDKSGNFYFNLMRKGDYHIKVDTKDDSYFALNESGKKLILTVGKGRTIPKKVEIRSPLIDHGSWKKIDFISGLKSNYINDIFTDSKGRVWYACHTGISVFDGNEYKSIGAQDSLPPLAVNKIFEDSKGTIFAALRHSYTGYGGLFTIDENYQVYDFLKDHRIPPQGIETITEDDNGNLIFAGWMGLYIYNGTKVDHFRYGDGMGSGQVQDILSDQSNLWLATSDGLVHYNGSTFNNYGLKNLNTNLRRVFKSPNGELYVSPRPTSGVSRNGIYKYDGFQFELVKATKLYNNIWDIVFDKNGGMFFNSSEYLIYSNNYISQALSPRWSTNTDMTWITTIESSTDGTISIGTWESGVWKYDMESVNTISDVDGVQAGINGTVVDNENNLWAGTYGGGVYKIKDNKIIKKYTTNDGLPSNDVRTLELDNFGNIWGTTEKGLFSLSGEKITIYGSQNGFASDNMWNVKISNQNTIWVSGEGFLSSMDGDVVRNYERKNDSTRFFGYNAGLLALDENNVLHGGTFLKKFERDGESYKFETMISDNWINGIQSDSSGNIFYSDAYEGIVKVKDGKKVFIHNTENGFLFDEPNTVYIDKKNWIWSASASGGVAFYDGNIWSYLDSEDGLLNNNVHGITSDKIGNYYFSHRTGITKYRPAKRQGLVSIDKVSTSTNDYIGNSLNNIKSLVKERMRFSFTSRNPNYRPGKDNFIFSIDSDDWNFSGVTKNPFLEWYPPKTGQFKISLRSVDRDLNYSDLEFLTIQILNPWYIRSSFLIPFLGFFGIILYTLYFSMNKFVKQKQFNEKLRLQAQMKDKKARLELEEKNKDLIETQKAAEAANEAKSTFLANMSHELRTPLNAIIGYSEMLIEDAEDENEDFIPDLDKINSSGKHLLGLINDILDLSKVESGKMELFIEEFELEKVLNEVASTITPLVEKNNNSLNVSINTETKNVSADITKIRQILLNLLSNATKFTKEGTIDIIVNDNSDSQSLLDFKVSDSGIGMTPEQVDKVFKPFTQADEKTTRKFGGTGLGLTITKMFSEMMGGGIYLESIINEGTTFTVTIPKNVIDPKKIKDNVEEVISKADPASFSILVIDDDMNAQELMKKFLTKEKYNVLQATSGHEGLDMAAKHLPDLITLDVMMPEMDGWEVLAALQNNEITKNIPVIMLTMANEPDIGYSLGATDYLTKPVNWGRLSKILEKHEIETSSQSILIVEDDEITRDMLKKSLETNEYKVTIARNGKEGLERVKKAKPALILLDLMMPEMDGFQFAEQLRENKKWLDIPVVVITAKDLTSEDHNRLKGNVEAIMQKGSYTKNELLSEVGERIKKLKERV